MAAVSKLDQQKSVEQTKTVVLYVSCRPLHLFQVVNLQISELAYRAQVLVLVRLVDRRNNVHQRVLKLGHACLPEAMNAHRHRPVQLVLQRQKVEFL